MANDKELNQQQDGGGDNDIDIAEVWERYNEAENDLYAEIAKNPGAIPIPGADGKPLEGIAFTDSTDIAKAFDGSLTDALENMVNAYIIFSEHMGTDDARASIMALAKTLQPFFDFLKSDDFAKMKAKLSNFPEWMQGIQERSTVANILFWASLSDDLKALLPFLLEEVKDLRKQPGMEDLTLRKFLQNVDENGEPTESLFSQAIKRARQKKNNIDIQDSATNIPIVTVKPIDKVEYPLDKPNSIIWNLLEVAEEIEFATEKHTSKKEATVVYSINFDELENEIAISKKLTPFDKRIYMAVSALFNGGNEIVSITQVLSKIGMTGKPSKQDVTKTLESLKKMLTAHIHIDNISEHKTYKNYPQFKYDGILLPIEIVSAYINGQLTESAVHIFREPPMITFAKERRQITTIPTHLLESPVSKTDQNLIIDNYLIERISRAKRGKTNKIKMLYNTIFENCNITTVKQKQRAPEKIERYLTHYIKCGFITRYNKIINGIEIYC